MGRKTRMIMIPIDQIEPRAVPNKHWYIRRRKFFDDIVKNGLKCPIWVKWHPELSKFIVIDGNHRYWGAVYAGLKEVPCTFEYDAEVAAISKKEREQYATI